MKLKLKPFKNLSKIFNVHNFYVIKRLWHICLKNYKLPIAIVLISTIIFSASNAASIALLKNIMDQGFFKNNFSALKILSFQIVGLFIVKAIFLYISSYLLSTTSLKATNSMRSKLFKHLLTMDMMYFENINSGVLIARVLNDSRSAGQLLVVVFNSFLRNFFIISSLLVVLIYQSPTLSLTVLVLFPVFFFLVRFLNKRMRNVYTGAMGKTEDLYSYITGIFHNISILKIYNREKYEAKRSSNFFNSLLKVETKASVIRSLAVPIIELLTGLMIGSILWFGGYLIYRGLTTPGSFMVFFVALFATYNPLKQFIASVPSIQQDVIAAERMLLVYDQIPQVVDIPNALQLKVTEGNIKFENVSFAYPKIVEKTKVTDTPEYHNLNAKAKKYINKLISVKASIRRQKNRYSHGKEGLTYNIIKDHDYLALNNISFEAKAGKVLALVGPSGSGKSTIVKLVSRFYDINKGEISIDNQDISKVTQASLRTHMSVVTQDIFLFDDSIRNNIAYGSSIDPSQISDEEVMSAAKKADAYDFIMELPNNFETIVGENGMKLSGGQKQRISIARAVLKDTPILLLDEATSSLDNESEKAVQKALSVLMKNRTTIVIAHRLSTIINADHIVVIENSKLIEQGTHDELISKKGRYNDLYKIQFKDI